LDNIKIQFKCFLNKVGTTQVEAALPLPGEINDGEKDIGDQPISLLLLRYLDPITTEDTVRILFKKWEINKYQSYFILHLFFFSFL